jgi:hypothetical protein
MSIKRKLSPETAIIGIGIAPWLRTGPDRAALLFRANDLTLNAKCIAPA